MIKFNEEDGKMAKPSIYKGYEIRLDYEPGFDPVYAVVDAKTGRHMADFDDVEDAREMIDEITEEMHAFNDGPFSSAQCSGR